MFKLEMTPFSSPSFRTFEPPKLDSGAPLSELRSVVRSRYDLDPRYVCPNPTVGKCAGRERRRERLASGGRGERGS